MSPEPAPTASTGTPAHDSAHDPAHDPARTSPSRPALRRVAVIGSGVAGLVAAHVLGSGATPAQVTLIEADHRLGGHADTHVVDHHGREIQVDTGFIVHNDRTYPTLLRLFAELGVQTQDSDMSMSVRSDEAHLEYAGARKARGLFPKARNLVNLPYLRMLLEVKRFHRLAQGVLAAPEDSVTGAETLGQFAERAGFSAYFRTYFLEPVVAAVWSCDPAVALEYPARYLFTFLDHHGMLTVYGSPTWRTIVGGSARYVEKAAAGIDEIRLSTPVDSVRETADGVVVTSGDWSETFDAVVIATHPHQALAILAEPTEAQRDVLGAIHYSPNVAQLHTDESVLPRSSGARASWNYWQRPTGAQTGTVLVSYDMTRLQRLDETQGATGRRYIVTLGGQDVVDQSTVIDTMHYEHPLYTPSSLAAQRRLPEIATDRIAFAGAYHGWGFHEDGALSGVKAAERLGFSWACVRAAPAAPVTATDATDATDAAAQKELATR